MIQARPHTDPALLRLLALLATLLASLLVASPAAAQDESDVQLELLAGLLFDSDIDLEGGGVRAGFRLGDRLWLEGRLEYYDVSRTLELWFLDLSLKYFFDDYGRSRWYVVGGPGTVFDEFQNFGEGDLFLHVGIGTEIDLTERLFLRPEIVGRVPADRFDRVAGHASVGLGWRF